VNYIAMSLLAVGVEAAGIVIGFSHRSFEDGFRLQLERMGASLGAER